MKRRTMFTVLPAGLLAAALVAYIAGDKLAPPGDGGRTRQYARGQLSFDYPASWKITEYGNDPEFQQVMLMSPTLEFCIVRRVRSENPPTTEEFANEFSEEGAASAIEALDDLAPGLAELVIEEPVHGFDHMSRQDNGGLIGILAPMVDHYFSKKIGREWIFITYSHDAEPPPGLLRAFDLILSTTAIRQAED